MASAWRASPGSRFAAAQAMIHALSWRTIPSRSAVLAPGSLVSMVSAMDSRSSARPRDSASTCASSSPVNSWHAAGIRASPSGGQPGSGRRRISSATAASLRAAMCASSRSPAHSTPISSASDAPSYRSSGPAAASASIARSGQPGITSSASPMPNAAARLPDSPGKTRAEPGWPGPRRPAYAVIAASAPVVPDRAPFAAARASASVAAPMPAISSGLSSSSPGGGGPSGSGYSSGSNGSSCPASASSHASRSSSVIGSGRVITGSQVVGSYSTGSLEGSGELVPGSSYGSGGSWVGGAAIHPPLLTSIHQWEQLIEIVLDYNQKYKPITKQEDEYQGK